jgi:Na+-driven multidrug efflux pump
MLRKKRNRPPYTALKGLIGGFGLGLLNVIVYLFFVIPIVAHDLFHSYMHYDSSTLAYAAAYVAILALLAIPAALFIAQALTKRAVDNTDTRDALLQQEPAPKYRGCDAKNPISF